MELNIYLRVIACLFSDCKTVQYRQLKQLTHYFTIESDIYDSITHLITYQFRQQCQRCELDLDRDMCDSAV